MAKRGKKKPDAGQLHPAVKAAAKAYGFRPGKGTGTDSRDIHDWQRPGWCESVDDERRGKVFCAKCQAEVHHVEVDGKWKVRDLDGLPHALSCGKARDDNES